MLKYLRIAVTALCLTACVLLVALWVRSYWRADMLEGFAQNQLVFGIFAERGLIACAWRNSPLAIFEVEIWHVDVSGVGHTEPLPGILGFSYGQLIPWLTTVTVPIWFIVMAMSTTAIVPWIRSIRRSFSLRTLLIATTLVAVALAAIVIAAR
jgi:hypothetical protein